MPTENRTTLTPDTPVRYLKGVGPKTAERFEKLGMAFQLPSKRSIAIVTRTENRCKHFAFARQLWYTE